MSSPNETPELKAGHPPAVKVAGMRVVQNKPPHEKPAAEPVKAESGEGDEGEKSTAVEVEKKPKEKLLVSGVAAKGNADFPPEAIRAFHEKQVPSKQVVNHIPINQVAHVQQPRKSNN